MLLPAGIAAQDDGRRSSDEPQKGLAGQRQRRVQQVDLRDPLA
jgi:hypothetical protein